MARHTRRTAEQIRVGCQLSTAHALGLEVSPAEPTHAPQQTTCRLQRDHLVSARGLFCAGEVWLDATRMA